jgi:hypothetical protein
LEGPAAIDDVFDNKNILSFDGDLDILGYFNGPGCFHPGSIASEADKINLDGYPEMSDQIGEEHEGTFKNADQHQFSSAIILRDLIGQVLNDGGDLLLREQWAETMSFHRLHPVRKPDPFE